MATGFAIAKVAAKLAVGYTLDEIPNDLTGTTPASFEPTLDYVVVKFPRFAFEKFPGADRTLGTQMKSVGETMGLGRTFAEAFLKVVVVAVGVGAVIAIGVLNASPATFSPSSFTPPSLILRTASLLLATKPACTSSGASLCSPKAIASSAMSSGMPPCVAVKNSRSARSAASAS